MYLYLQSSKYKFFIMVLKQTHMEELYVNEGNK